MGSPQPDDEGATQTPAAAAAAGAARASVDVARLATVVRWGAVALAALWACLYAWRATLSGDEGWYLDAARRVLDGELPYRDFAYTQGPLLPFAYAPVAAVLPGSLLAARLFNAMLWVATVVLAGSTARRYGGAPAAALASLLLALSPFSAYYAVIIKTYGLVGLLLVATARALAVDRGRPWGLPLGAALACLAATTRISMAPFAMAVVLLGLIVARSNVVRAAVAGAAAAVGAAALSLVVIDLAGAKYGLWDYHQQVVPPGQTRGQWLRLVLEQRVPGAVHEYIAWVIAGLAAAILVVVTPSGRRALRAHPELPTLAIGVALASAAHVVAGAFYLEYQRPILPIAGLLLATVPALIDRRVEPRPLTHDGPGAGLAFTVVLAAVGLATFVGDAYIPARVLGGGNAISRVDEVADVVARNTHPNDRVLTLEAEIIPYVARRETQPGVSLGFYSYQDVTDEDVERLHVLNQRAVADVLERRDPAVVVFTDRDVRLFSRRGALTQVPADPRVVLDPLERGYERIFRVEVWDTQGIGATVWRRRPT